MAEFEVPKSMAQKDGGAEAAAIIAVCLGARSRARDCDIVHLGDRPGNGKVTMDTRKWQRQK
jgi:hypothetical protein